MLCACAAGVPACCWNSASLIAVPPTQVVKRMAATGRLELPADMQASLDALEQGLLGCERSCGSVGSSVRSARTSSAGSRAAAAQLEAALQQALEEEILAEISREASLQVRACVLSRAANACT